MSKKRQNNYLPERLQELQSLGIYAFSVDKIRAYFPKISKEALALALNRQVQKKRIASVHKGFYVIIPPEYASQGMLPPPLFIDALMKHLGRKYYVGLLNAAAMHGAAHQQPQDYFVVTGLPALRKKNLNSITLCYVSKKLVPLAGVEQRKTDTGFIQISTPELTALDLIQFEHTIGGLNRVAQVLSDLIESMDAKKIRQLLTDNEVPAAYVQRLGFILRRVLDDAQLSGILLDYLDHLKKPLQNVPLKAKGKRSGFPIDSNWKIIENIEINPPS